MSVYKLENKIKKNEKIDSNIEILNNKIRDMFKRLKKENGF